MILSINRFCDTCQDKFHAATDKKRRCTWKCSPQQRASNARIVEFGRNFGPKSQCVLITHMLWKSFMLDLKNFKKSLVCNNIKVSIRELLVSLVFFSKKIFSHFKSCRNCSGVHFWRKVWKSDWGRGGREMVSTQ